jgi:hypothetical protein
MEKKKKENIDSRFFFFGRESHGLWFFLGYIYERSCSVYQHDIISALVGPPRIKWTYNFGTSWRWQGGHKSIRTTTSENASILALSPDIPVYTRTTTRRFRRPTALDSSPISSSSDDTDVPLPDVYNLRCPNSPAQVSQKASANISPWWWTHH